MKFIHKIALLVWTLSLPIGAMGALVDAKTAASAVKGWLQFDQKPLKVSLGAKVANVETYNDNTGVPSYYVVNFEPSGFAIVPADDQVEPIIAFVEKGHFDPSPLNPLGALISKDVPVRVAQARAQGHSPGLQASSSKWQKLVQKSSGIQPKGIGVGGSVGISDLRVAPFIQTLWDQGDQYTTVTNMIWVTNTLVVTTYFASLPLGDFVFTNVAVTNMGGTLLITNGPGNPVNYVFGGLTKLITITNGPDLYATNLISITAYISMVFTNEFGQVIANRVIAGNKVITDSVTNAIGPIVHQISVPVGIPMLVSDAKACYNYFTPPHEPRNSDNYVCGCVATAMAQLMYYFQCPATGVGTTRFQVTVDGGVYSIGRNLRGGDGLGGPYDWNNMPLASDYYSLTPTQAQAVGALTADAGVAVHMQYSASSSSSYLSDAKTALVNTFKYNNAIINSISSLDTNCFQCSLYKMMNPNLDARLPVLLGITGDPGGHCIVADGYGYCFGSLYHHLNLGWSGAYNAWYQLPIIDMYGYNGLPTYSYFWDVTQCIFNVFTNGTGEIISGRVLNTNGIPVANALVNAYSTKGGYFTSTTDPNGIYALTGVPSDSTCIITVTNDGYFAVTSNVVTHLSYDNGTDCGNVWGANFILTPAQGPPVFISQPTDQFVTVGSNATFTTFAAGQLPLAYQWQINPSGTTNWIDVTDDATNHGSQTATFSISPTDLTMNGAPFHCVASNSLGTTNSEQATLNVIATPFISLGTLAGLAGVSGSSNGINTNARFFNPHGIAVDSQTNIYVADTFNHVIRQLKQSGPNWVVTTIAGAVGNYGTNNGKGANAQFNGPFGIAVNGNGDLFVADTGNSTIRKVAKPLQGTNWVVTTISGQAGLRGSTDGINALFNFPMGIALDSSGNIFVADEGNHNIRKIAPSGSAWVASTIAGSGNYGSNDGTNHNAQFGQPYAIAVNNNNNTVFVADQFSHTIRQLKPVGANWVVTTIAGVSGSSGAADGIGSAARFKYPTGIACGTDGKLYVADNGNNTIRRLTLLGTNWSVFTAAGLAGSTGSFDGIGGQIRLNGPFGIALDSHTNVYVSDSLNHTIRGISAPLITVNSVNLTKASAASPFVVTWSAVMNYTYQVQYKTNMSQVDWINYTTVTASNWTGKISVPVGAEPQRFYRVIPSP